MSKRNQKLRLNCEQCGTVFERCPSNRRNTKHDFCGMKCFGAWWKLNHPPVTNKNTLGNLRSDYWANPLISPHEKELVRVAIGKSSKERFTDPKNHPRWISDRTKLMKKQERSDVAYKEWRKNVWIRDSHKCRISNPDCDGRIEAHHILGWSEHPELRYEVNNGITLCHAHHPRKRAEEAELAPVFQGLVAVNANEFCPTA